MSLSVSQTQIKKAIRIEFFLYNIRILEDFLPKRTICWFILYLYSLYVKVKCALVQVLRLCTGRTAHTGE